MEEDSTEGNGNNQKNQGQNKNFTYNREMIPRHFNQMQEMYITENTSNKVDQKTEVDPQVQQKTEVEPQVQQKTEVEPQVQQNTEVGKEFSIQEDESGNGDQLSGDLKFIKENLPNETNTKDT